MALYLRKRLLRKIETRVQLHVDDGKFCPQCAIRIPANDVLEREMPHLLKRPVDRPPKQPIVLYAGRIAGPIWP